MAARRSPARPWSADAPGHPQLAHDLLECGRVTGPAGRDDERERSAAAIGGEMSLRGRSAAGALLAGPGGVLMGTDDRIGLCKERDEDLRPGAVGSPHPQPVVGTLSGPEALGQVHSRSPGAVLERDRVDHLPVIPPPPTPLRCPVRQQRLDACPLGVSQRHASTNGPMIGKRRSSRPRRQSAGRDRCGTAGPRPAASSQPRARHSSGARGPNLPTPAPSGLPPHRAGWCPHTDRCGPGWEPGAGRAVQRPWRTRRCHRPTAPAFLLTAEAQAFARSGRQSPLDAVRLRALFPSPYSGACLTTRSTGRFSVIRRKRSRRSALGGGGRGVDGRGLGGWPIMGA